MKYITYTATLILFLSGCMSAEFAIPPELDEYAHIWQLRRSEENGRVSADLNGYHASVTKQSIEYNSLPTDYSRLVEATETLQFDVTDQHGIPYNFTGQRLVTATFTNVNQPVPSFEYNTDLFTGRITQKTSNISWHLQINIPRERYNSQIPVGHISGNNIKINIHTYGPFNYKKRQNSMCIPGYKFVLNKKIVAIVDTRRNGKIWIHSGLHGNVKPVISVVTMSMLLRNDLNHYIEFNNTDHEISHINQPDNFNY